jgi:acyl-coenzyme A thioesterase PaaI-like protein
MSERYRVTAKQPNSQMCHVCGLQNEAGLQARFYELEQDQLIAICHPAHHHQGYPQRAHGGIVASLLDETIGRAIRLRYQDDIWGVTIELRTRFRQPIPLEQPMRVIGAITDDSRRGFEGTGRVLLPDGRLAAEAHGRYLKIPLADISDFDFEHQQWRVIHEVDDPTEIEF